MASNIPVIVQGNSFSLAIPLQIYYINEGQMDLQDYTPDPTDDVTVQLKGSRRNYTYTPTIDGNVANIDLTGNELADNYSVVVSIVKDNGQRLRSFRTDQFFIVESSDDLTTDDIIQGLEENVIYLNSSIFVAGEDGRGIESITKTSTSGLVDTYTITYNDNTTSTFQVTNGANGQAGAQGADGVGITSIEKTATVGLVDTYTITMSDGTTTTFDVTNGKDGVDLGLAEIADNLTTDDPAQVLSARQGKIIGDILIDKHGVVSPNTPIASQSTSYPTSKWLANNFTTSNWIYGINVVVRASTALKVAIYDVNYKYVVQELINSNYDAGSHTITFNEPVKLGTNQYIALKTTQLNTATSGGVGYYLDGVLTSGKEASYELLTLVKALQTKVSDLEDVTENLPTIEADVLGTSGKYISPIHPIFSFTTALQGKKYYANRFFTTKKILGVRLFAVATTADVVDIGIYDVFTNTASDLQTSNAVVQGLNTILLNTPVYLAPNQLIAVKAPNAYFIGLINNGDVGMYADQGTLSSTYALSYELIVEDSGLMGEVADLEKINTHKSWCSAGTSITELNNVIGANTRFARGYQSRVMDKIAFSAFTNQGHSGQSAAGLARNIDSSSLGLTAVADYYTIEHGINDWNNNVAVGTIDDFINNTGNGTFYGAYRIIIDKVYTLNANAQIILITPRKAYGSSQGLPDHWWEAKNGRYLKDYADAAKAIGEFMSFPVCDWFGESNTNQNNLVADSVDVALHPNDVGYQKLANLLVQTFKKVID